jgi:hypothetical protein
MVIGRELGGELGGSWEELGGAGAGGELGGGLWEGTGGGAGGGGLGVTGHESPPSPGPAYPITRLPNP